MMHERSYIPPFNLNGYESTATRNLLYRRAYWPRNGKRFASGTDTHKPIKERSRKEKCGSMPLEGILNQLFNIIEDMTVIMQASFMVAEPSYCKDE
jgi:hypothetical protein